MVRKSSVDAREAKVLLYLKLTCLPWYPRRRSAQPARVSPSKSYLTSRTTHLLNRTSKKEASLRKVTIRTLRRKACQHTIMAAQSETKIKSSCWYLIRLLRLLIQLSRSSRSRFKVMEKATCQALWTYTLLMEYLPSPLGVRARSSLTRSLLALSSFLKAVVSRAHTRKVLWPSRTVWE
jgi:hypothetical protein